MPGCRRTFQCLHNRLPGPHLAKDCAPLIRRKRKKGKIKNKNRRQKEKNKAGKTEKKEKQTKGKRKKEEWIEKKEKEKRKGGKQQQRKANSILNTGNQRLSQEIRKEDQNERGGGKKAVYFYWHTQNKYHFLYAPKKPDKTILRGCLSERRAAVPQGYCSH